MRKKLCIYTLFIMICLVACDIPAPSGNYKTIAHETWDRDSGYKFEFNITQPGTYSLSTCVRHTTDYTQKNISCYLTVSRAGINDIRVNSDITLADSEGSWLGQGLGGLKTVVHTSKESFHLDSTGIYTIEIRHRMKEKTLEGIKDIGVRLNKLED